LVVWVKCGRVMSGGIFAAWAKNESRRFPYSSVQCRTPSVQYGTRAGCTELGPGVRNSACPVRKPGRRTELEPGVRNSAGPVYGTRASRYGSRAGVRNSACPVRKPGRRTELGHPGTEARPVYGTRPAWYGTRTAWYGSRAPWYGTRAPWYGDSDSPIWDSGYQVQDSDCLTCAQPCTLWHG